MAKAVTKAGRIKNSTRSKPQVSELGRKLTRIHELYIKSGGKPLTRKQIEREVAERRGGRL